MQKLSSQMQKVNLLSHTKRCVGLANKISCLGVPISVKQVLVSVTALSDKMDRQR